jgi:hypothetical protein
LPLLTGCVTPRTAGGLATLAGAAAVLAAHVAHGRVPAHAHEARRRLDTWPHGEVSCGRVHGAPPPRPDSSSWGAARRGGGVLQPLSKTCLAADQAAVREREAIATACDCPEDGHVAARQIERGQECPRQRHACHGPHRLELIPHGSPVLLREVLYGRAAGDRDDEQSAGETGRHEGADRWRHAA